MSPADIQAFTKTAVANILQDKVFVHSGNNEFGVRILHFISLPTLIPYSLAQGAL
jgi:hypothetical protein